MLIDFLIVCAITTTTALIWRAVLLDHSRLLSFVKGLPLVGGGLSCGFCATLWFSLIAVSLDNPLSWWRPDAPFIVQLCIGWFTIALTVLFLRNLIAVLMEGNGVLTDMHRGSHKEELK